MDKLDLSRFRVKNAPSTVYYIPDFISPEEEQQLMARVYQAPKTKWTVLSHRRLQNWGGLPGPKGMVAEDLPQWLQVYSEKIAELGAFEGKLPNHVLVNEYLPGQGIMPHEDGPAFFPTVSTISLGSHTLLDFYYHLNDPHTTAPDDACLGAVRSTCTQHGEGEELVMGDGENSMDRRNFLSLLLQPRSLLLLQDDMYKIHLHGIKEVTQDCITEKVANLDLVPEVNVGDVMERKTRVSLTIRFVPKVIKSRLILGKRK